MEIDGDGDHGGGERRWKNEGFVFDIMRVRVRVVMRCS